MQRKTRCDKWSNKFKPKARRERHNGSAVKADMYMREKYSKQMVNGLSEVLFK